MHLPTCLLTISLPWLCNIHNNKDSFFAVFNVFLEFKHACHAPGAQGIFVEWIIEWMKNFILGSEVTSLPYDWVSSSMKQRNEDWRACMFSPYSLIPCKSEQRTPSSLKMKGRWESSAQSQKWVVSFGLSPLASWVALGKSLQSVL